MEYIANSVRERLGIKTIFFGGGTPSLLPIEYLGRVFFTINEHFRVLPGCEITLEANPGTLSQEYLNNLVSLGVNRVSFGMQSANPAELHLLERMHSFWDVCQSVDMAHKAGIHNLNLDLIYGLPEQTTQQWESNLRKALQLCPDHLSLYALSLEHGTPMENWVRRGLVSRPDDDSAADMYEFSMELLAGEGYHQYEISNWAGIEDGGAAKVCQHNLQYWRNQPYLGVGAGAHGYANRFRVANVLSPAQYIRHNAVGWENQQLDFPRTPSTVSSQHIGEEDEMAETMIMGLRLVEEGVSRGEFFQRFHRSLNGVYGTEINLLIKQGLLEWGGDGYDRLRLTQIGRLVGNQVFIHFV